MLDERIEFEKFINSEGFFDYPHTNELQQETKIIMSPITKLALIATITIGLTLVFAGYSYVAFEGEIYDFDFGLGMLFVASAAFTVGLSTLGIISFKRSLQGIVWLLILSSLLINAIADIWYYHLELFEGYVPLNTIDTLYLATWMIMFYGLFRHYRYST